MGEFGPEKYEKLDTVDKVTFVGDALPAGITTTFDSDTQTLTFSDGTKLDFSKLPDTGPIASQEVYLQSATEGGTYLLKFSRKNSTELVIAAERKQPTLKKEKSVPKRGMMLKPVAGSRYGVSKIVPFRDIDPNRLPEQFPNHGIDFADVRLDGQKKERYIIVQEKVGLTVIDVSYKISVRNEKGVLIYSLTKEAEPLPTALTFPPERQLYVTKPFTGGAQIQGNDLIISDASGQELRRISLKKYPQVQQRGAKVIFDKEVFDWEQTKRLVTIENTPTGLVGGIEEYVPVEKNIAWIGNPAQNRLTAFKAELQPDGQTIFLKNTRTNTYVNGVDGKPISAALTTADFARETTDKGRTVAEHITIGGVPYNIYLQKQHGIAQLAAESLDVQGDVEFSIISLLSVGRRVPGQWFIKPVDKATFTQERKLTVGIRLSVPGTDGKKPTLKESEVTVSFTPEEIFSTPDVLHNIPGGLNYPAQTVSKKVILDGVTYSITFRNDNGKLTGSVNNITPVVDKKPELKPVDDKDPTYAFDAPLKDKDIFGGKEIWGYHKRLESPYTLDAGQQKRFDRLTLGRDRLWSLAGNKTDFDVYRDDRLDPFSTDHPLEMGIDDSLIDFDLDDFKDAKGGWTKTAEGYKKKVQAEDFFATYDNEEWELEVKLVPRLLTYDQPITDPLDPRRMNGQMTERITKQEGYFMRAVLNIPPTSQFWQEERTLDDVLPDFSTLLTPVEYAKRKVGQLIDKIPSRKDLTSWSRWKGEGRNSNVGECVEPNTGLSRSELLGVGFQRPVDGHKAGRGAGSDYGDRWGGDFHGGIDIPGKGLDVKSVYPGKLLAVGTGGVSKDPAGGNGNYVSILHEVEIKGKKVYFKTMYLHFGETGKSGISPAIMAMKVGDMVPAGTLLGKSGNTGHIVSSGDGSHLHFEVQLCDKDGNRVSGTERDYTVNPCYFYGQDVSGIPDSSWGCYAEGLEATSTQGVVDNLVHASTRGHEKEYKEQFYESNIETAIKMYDTFQKDPDVPQKYKDVVLRDDMLGIFLNETGFGKANHADGWFQCTPTVYADIQQNPGQYPVEFLKKYAADNGDLTTITSANCKEGPKSVAVALARMAQSAYQPLKSGGFEKYLKSAQFKNDKKSIEDIKNGADANYSFTTMETEVNNKGLKFEADALNALVQRIYTDTNLQKRFVVIRRYNVPNAYTSNQAVYYALKVLYYSEYTLKGVAGINKPETSGAGGGSGGNTGGTGPNASGGGGGNTPGNGAPEHTPTGTGPFSQAEVDGIAMSSTDPVRFEAANGGPRTINGVEITGYRQEIWPGNVLTSTFNLGQGMKLARKGNDAYIISREKNVVKIDRSMFEYNANGGWTKPGQSLTIDGKVTTLTYKFDALGAGKKLVMGAEVHGQGAGSTGNGGGQQTPSGGSSSGLETQSMGPGPFSAKELSDLQANKDENVVLDAAHGGPREINGLEVGRYNPQVIKGNVFTAGNSRDYGMKLIWKGSDLYLVSPANNVAKIDRSKFQHNEQGGYTKTGEYIVIDGKATTLTYRFVGGRMSRMLLMGAEQF